MSKMDRLYGVTMPEKGISQLVAVDLTKSRKYGCLNYTFMSNDQFKTRLEIAKKKISKKELFDKNE